MSLNFLHFDILLQNAVFFAVISNLGENVNWMILYKVYIVLFCPTRKSYKETRGQKVTKRVSSVYLYVKCLFYQPILRIFFPSTFLIKFPLYSMPKDFVFLTFSDIGITMVLSCIINKLLFLLYDREYNVAGSSKRK